MMDTPDAKPMGEAQVLEFVQDYIDFFDRAATKHRKMDTRLRLSLIILSAIVPALTASKLPADWAVLTTTLAVMVAIFTNIDSYFRPAAVWRHNRSAFLRLQSMHRRYLCSKLSGEPEKYTLKDFYRDADELVTTQMLAYSDLRGFKSEPPK